MEAKEIKFELCKIALTNGCSLDHVKPLYEWIMEDGNAGKSKKEDISTRPISELLLGMIRHERGRGFVARFNRIASDNDIKTVGELLDLGKHNFSRVRSVGRGLVVCINEALFDLYGIENW